MELLLVASVFVVSIATLQRATGARRNLILVVLLVGSLAAVPHFLRKPAAGTEGDPGTEQVPAQVKDFGYVSSKACRTCHPSEYTSWYQSYHRTMTQVVTPDTVVSDWQGTLTWRDKAYHLERDGDEYWVDMVDPGWRAADATKRVLIATNDSNERVRKRVLMSTGSHHQQVYWLSSGQAREMEQFAFTWLIDEERWIPYEESFLRPKLKDEERAVWNTSCIKCHATFGQPGLDEAGIPDTKVAELGIACEACHGPGAAHVLANSNPARRYALHLSGQDDPTIINPGKLSAERSSEICGQCHSVLAITPDRYAKWRKVGYDYRPGDSLHDTRPPVRRPPGDEGLSPQEVFRYDLVAWFDGCMRVPREYSNFLNSPCYQGELSCLSCHSMHGGDPNGQLRPDLTDDEACLQCHEALRERVAEHTHHPIESTGSSCDNCHMPHTTYALFKAIRSHTIGASPSLGESVFGRRPNACNLCHLDKSLAWTGRYLEKWYGQTPVALPSAEERERSAALLWLLRGDAGERALVAWSMGWDPAVEASSGREWLAPFLIEALDDPYAAVRFIANRSLTRLPGFEDLQFDYVAPEADRVRVRDQARTTWREQFPRLERFGADRFFDSQGRLDEAAIKDVVTRRDDRIVDLKE